MDRGDFLVLGILLIVLVALAVGGVVGDIIANSECSVLMDKLAR